MKNDNTQAQNGMRFRIINSIKIVIHVLYTLIIFEVCVIYLVFVLTPEFKKKQHYQF